MDVRDAHAGVVRLEVQIRRDGPPRLAGVLPVPVVCLCRCSCLLTEPPQDSQLARIIHGPTLTRSVSEVYATCCPRLRFGLVASRRCCRLSLKRCDFVRRIMMKSNPTRAGPSPYGNLPSNLSNGNEVVKVTVRRVGGGTQPASEGNDRRRRGQVKTVREVSRFGRGDGPSSLTC